MEHLNFEIETRHLPRLEAELIEYATLSEDILGGIEACVLHSEDSGDVISQISMLFEDAFEDVRCEIADTCEDDAVPGSDCDDIDTLGLHLADCFEVQSRYYVATVDQPDFEHCAIRCFGAYMEWKHGGRLDLLNW
jgi:hypothetical protein